MSETLTTLSKSMIGRSCFFKVGQDETNEGVIKERIYEAMVMIHIISISNIYLCAINDTIKKRKEDIRPSPAT